MSRISNLAGFTTAISTTEDLTLASISVGSAVTANSHGINLTGVITATTFSGDGGGLTGVASTDNITTSTRVRFLDNLSVSGVSTLGSAVTVGQSGIHVTGIVTTTNVSVGSSVTASTFFGSGANLTALNGDNIASGTVAAARVATLNQNTTGTAGGLSGTPDIAINNITGVAATFTGNVTIGGTLTYLDVTSVDSVGIITAQKGVQVLADGVDVTGVGTFKSGLNLQGVLREEVNITAGKLSENQNINLDNGMAHLFTTTETTTSTPNIVSSIGINTTMAIGEVLSVSIITTAAAAGYSAQLTIDGVAVTERWNGGSAPSAGGSSGNDFYSYTIIKTGDAAYTVLANLSNFA